MTNTSLDLIYKKLQLVQSQKKILESIKLENNVDISSDKCYITLVGQITILKALIKEIENEARRSGGVIGRFQT